VSDSFELLRAVAIVSTPLLLAATGEYIVERSGVLNIAIEGAMLAACCAAFSVTLVSGNPWLGLLAAVAAGALVGALLAVLAVVLEADAVVAGTALNLATVGAAAIWFRAHGESGSGAPSQVAGLPPLFLPVAALVLLVGCGVVVAKTRLGLALRACGENAAAAAVLGVPVRTIRCAALVCGGAFAGLAGAELLLVESRTFVEGMTAGRGFVALAIVVAARWSARGIPFAALLFGGATVLQFRFQAGGSPLPYPVFLMLPYVATLVVLAVLAGRSRPPGGLVR
jgi:general nucleoside transport system permease protein